MACRTHNFKSCLCSIVDPLGLPAFLVLLSLALFSMPNDEPVDGLTASAVRPNTLEGKVQSVMVMEATAWRIAYCSSHSVGLVRY